MGEFHSHPGAPGVPPRSAAFEGPDKWSGRPIAVFVDGVRQDGVTSYDVATGSVERTKITNNGKSVIEQVSGLVKVKWA